MLHSIWQEIVINQHCHVTHKMQFVVTVVPSLCVCVTQLWVLRKRMNWFRCHLGDRLVWVKGILCKMWVQNPLQEGALLRGDMTSITTSLCCGPVNDQWQGFLCHLTMSMDTSVTAAALAASPSARCVQDRGARTSVACWSGSRVLPTVAFCRTLVAVQFQWHVEAAHDANT